MAALDAVRVLPADPTSTAQASALRNNFPYTDPGYSLVVEWAPTIAGPFTSLPANLGAATVVRVTASTPQKDFFPGGGDPHRDPQGDQQGEPDGRVHHRIVPGQPQHVVVSPAELA